MRARFPLTTSSDNIAATSISGRTATIQSHVDGVEISREIRFDDVRAANEAGRLHEVFYLLNLYVMWVTMKADKFVSFSKYTSPARKLDIGVPEAIVTAVCRWLAGTGGWVVIDLQVSSLSGGMKALHRVVEIIDSLVPRHFFLSSGPFKFVLQMIGIDERYGRTLIGGVLSVRIHTVDKAINLSYWETYVEPWLHFPVLLQKGNAKIADRVLAYWSGVAGRALRLEDLETAITVAILKDGWNDNVWLGAHDLLATDV